MALKLSTSEFYTLVAIGTGDKHGYRIMKDIHEITSGLAALGPGSLYTGLKALLSQGLIKKTRQAGRRQYYAITFLGLQQLNNELHKYEKIVLHAKSAYSRQLS